MTLTEDGLGSFGKLAQAFGLLTGSGTNSAWFTDPLGTGTTPGLRTILSDPAQRGALLDFVDEILGPPVGRTVGTSRWVPLFQSDDPTLTVYAVVTTLPGSVRVGVGVDHTTGTTAPFVTTRLHVPLVHLPNGTTDTRPTGGSDPVWLLIGQPEGVIELELDATFTTAAPIPGESHLGGTRVRLCIPTGPGAELGFGLDLVDLQLPGAAAPTTRVLDVTSIATLGSDVFEFLVGLVRAQAAALDLTDPTFRHVAGLTAVLGLRETAGIPPLPLADLPTQGVTALVHWVEEVLGTGPARAAWLAELARLVGGTPVTGRDAVSLTLGDVALVLGLRVTPGPGGHPVLVPWAEVAYATRAGVSVGGGIDLLRIDTGSGDVQAVPQVRATAIFGADSAPGAAKLLPTGPVQVGSAHIGVALDGLARPAFVLTLHDVDIAAGGAPSHHDVLDLSSPDAALDALDAAVESALRSALEGLGAAGTLLEQLLGIDPPGTVDDVSILDLIADPLAAMRTYYRALVADTDAMRAVLGALRALLDGAPATPVDGPGTSEQPWRLPFTATGGGAGAGLAVWRADGHLLVAAAADLALDVLADLRVTTDLRVVLVDVDLGGGHVALAPEASARVLLAPRGTGAATLSLGVADLQLRGVGAEATWRAGRGFGARVVGDGLVLAITDVTSSGPGGGLPSDAPVLVDLPLPTFDATGALTWTPDWDDIELALGRLLALPRLPIVDAFLDLLGWNPALSAQLSGSVGARLSLGALFADPASAIADWATDLALDCQHLQSALGVLTTVLSGGSLRAPLGLGREDLAYRAPVAGVAEAPGIFVWTDPPCPPVTTGKGRIFELFDGLDVPADGAFDQALPVGSQLVAAMRRAAPGVPGLDDLLVARPSLGAGLDALVTRWTGTDGVTGPASGLPSDVASLVLPGYAYAELAALGRSSQELLADLTVATDAVVHVGCDDGWGAGYPAADVIDATGGPSGAGPPTATIGEDAARAWYVRVPTPQAAAAARPDHDGVAGQAAHLVEVLAGRAAPIVLVGYGAAGAAAVRAAATLLHVSAVVTVGTPWADVLLTSVQSGTGGDALSFVRRLVPPAAPDEVWPDELLALQTSPLRRGRDLVHRSVAVAGAADLPSAGGEARRSGLEVKAVFGALGGGDAVAGLTSVITQTVVDRSEAAVAATAAASSNRPDHLHVGVDVPAASVDLGGLTVGGGLALELVHVARTAAPSTGATLEAVRGITVTFQLAVTDGWLIGGPGAPSRELEVRWLEARVHVPLSLGGRPAGPGSTELVLHEAGAFAAYRDRWVVRADGATTVTGTLGATTALPEVKILLGEVIGRVRTAAPALADLLEAIGLVRAGGLDPDGIDRLLFDPGALLRPLVAAAPATIALAVNELVGAATDAERPASAIDLGGPDGRVRIDLATGTVAGSTTVRIAGMPPVALSFDAGPAGATAGLRIGSVDPDLGGLALVLGAATGTGLAARVDHRAPGASATTAVALLPAVDVRGLQELVAVVLPAALLQGVLATARDLAESTVASVIDDGLAALGLLGAAADNGTRTVLLPLGLLADPGAWLSRRADPLAAAVAALDALAPLVAPARGTQPGWPLDPAFGITYAVVAGRLELVAHLHLTETVDGASVAVDVDAGIAIATTAAPQPIVDVEVTVDGWGLGLRADGGIFLDLLRPAPGTPLALHPSGAGLGSVLAGVGVSLVPQALNAVAARRADPAPSLAKDVGAAVYELGDALGLLAGTVGARQFTSPLLDAFALDPAGSLLAHLPALASAGLAALAHALDPTGTLVSVSSPSTSVRRFSFGLGDEIHLDVDGTPGRPALDLGGSFALQGAGGVALGHVSLDHLRLAADGVQVDVRVGPVRIDLGSVTLRPVVAVRAGVASGTFTRMLGVGVGLDDAGERSVEIRWALDASAPALAQVTRTSGGESVITDLGVVTLDLVSVAVSLASGIIADQLGSVVSAAAQARLQGVVFSGGTSIDPGLIADLLDPEALLGRLYRLAWNCAVGPNPLRITIDDAVTIGLASVAAGTDQRLGLSVSLVPGTRYAIVPAGEVVVNLEVDASWVDPVVPAGLAIHVLSGPSATDLDIDFGLSVAGVGLRFTKTGGPLLELGSIAMDGLALHLYGEASASGVGGGVRLQLSGLAVSPGGGGGNGMANSLLNDAGEAGANNRPTFSPSLAIQKHPGRDVAVGLRAGDPPGPWWVVVQRQLGPIYMERIGLDTVEAGGRVTRISLLFSGSVSLFGLNAAVDQLSLSWNGGDVLSLSSWSADLMGLAVSADMAGVSLAGGLLKSVDEHGVTSYVGMLVGRFATYGLSVFGGYASDPHGHASFFVFGGVTGPIGGPPAFFLTGIGGGLGINRGLVIPSDLSEFPVYPFIVALDPAYSPPANPMDSLRDLNVFFPHSPGNFWFAAGISFTSFALVDGVAVVAVAFGDGLDINLLGLARMALPRPGAALISIELALLARFSTGEGVFMIKAQLTDNSWLLSEDIRLTGGFAFMLWWKGPLSGQFVLTMGGYHPDFHRDGYPEVPRLGMVWRISDAISMKGESYFALTSEALMAGTKVDVSVDFGWVWARITFGADGIVYFDPFFFDVRAYCRISAGIDIDLGLFSVSLSITIGASIHVWGPEFAGQVTFEIGPCEVPIRFGPQAEQPGRTLDWPGFVAKYLEDAGGGRARALGGITGRGTLPTSTKGQQGAPSADGSASLPFRVFAEFEISFTTTVPTTSFAVGTTVKPMPVTLSNGAGSTLGLAPMGAGELTSQLVIVLKRRQGTAWVNEPDLAKLAANLVAAQPAADASRTSTDAFPTGVWGQPKSLGAAVQPLPSGDVVVTGNRVTLVAGIETKTQGPSINFYQVTSGRRPLPLRAKGTDRTKLLQAASGVTTPVAASAAAALTMAEQTLFGAGTTATRGAPPSALGRAAYAFDRVAPPRFGTLADGLAKANGAAGDRTVLEPPAAPEAPPVRSPFVVGYLASGIGAASRGPSTTVADGRIKRRSAPTTDSVRGRLGVHVPAVLQRVAPPAMAKGDRLLPSLSVPRTDVVGAVRTVATGPVGQLPLNRIIGGVGAAPTAPRRSSRDARPDRIPTGDVVALQLPDARIDVGEERPVLEVEGRARVVMVSPHGVVFDDDALHTAVTVPAGVSMVAVQADGDADAVDGWSGWHERSRVGVLADRLALGAGCTIEVDGHGSPTALGWDVAASLTVGADEVHTRFARPMRTVAVALTGVAPRNLDRTQVHLVGATLTRDRRGDERRPVVVTLGETTVLVYAVTPERRATGLTVSITPGADWVVSAVLGAGAPNEAPVAPAAMAELIARDGLAATTAQLTVMQGPGCAVDWRPARGPQAETPPRARAATKATAKKTAAKKTAAKKTAKKSTAKKKAPRRRGT